MSYSFLGVVAGAGTTCAVTYVGGETAFVCVEIESGTASDLAISDGTNTYSLIAGPIVAVGTNNGAAIFKADNVAAGSFTVAGTVTGGAGGSAVRSLTIATYAGLAAGPVQSSSTRVIDASVAPPDNVLSAAVTPTAAPALLIAFNTKQNANATITSNDAGTGFTRRSSFTGGTYGTCLIDREVASTSVTGAVFSVDWNYENFAIVAAVVGYGSPPEPVVRAARAFRHKYAGGVSP